MDLNQEILGFLPYSNYLDHKGMEKMLEGENGKKLEELARNISVCLHEDWKQNLIREKGEDYQHFRPVKDAAFAEEVLANKDDYLKRVSEDGKPLYRIVESEKDGKTLYEVQFDLIRVPFEKLTQKWQEANLEAAKFALCLVQTACDNGDLNKTGEELFDVFEAMSHDVHTEWMQREGDWANEALLLPYEYLTVDTNGYNQKDKDRAHINATTTELTFQPNILARNRSIVQRAIYELFGQNATESGLNPEILENLKDIQGLINSQNDDDYASYVEIKKAVSDKAYEVLKNKNSSDIEALEKMAKTYFEAWKTSPSVKKLGKLPKSVDVKYENLEIVDPRVNYKNISRYEVKKILIELEKELKDDPKFSEVEGSDVFMQRLKAMLNSLNNEKSDLNKKILDETRQEYEEYISKNSQTNE